jgi:hypothetical protein
VGRQTGRARSLGWQAVGHATQSGRASRSSCPTRKLLEREHLAEGIGVPTWDPLSFDSLEAYDRLAQLKL